MSEQQKAGFGVRKESLPAGLLKDALNGSAFMVFDGAMGTMLQRNGLAAGELPELLCLNDAAAITRIHREYVEAGSDVVTTNTFGANSRKLSGPEKVQEVFEAAVRCARESGARFVAADVGPLGDLIFPMGDLGFTQAYELFAEQGRAIAKTDADVVIIETMADVLEMTAAVLAMRDTCSLPILSTMTFTASGRTFLGTKPADAAVIMATLGVDALGVNCSAGPADLQPVVKEMLEVSPRPVIVQANAGLPEVVDGVTAYTLGPDEYARAVAPMIQAGATIVGGCCGTDSAYVSALRHQLETVGLPDAPANGAAFRQRAQEIIDEGTRDSEILEAVLDATDEQGLKEALAEDYDPD